MASGVRPEDVAWAEKELERLKRIFARNSHVSADTERGALLLAVEFLRVKAGPQSQLYVQAAEAARAKHMSVAAEVVRWALTGWIELVEAGIAQFPVEAQARLGAATDLMEQVEALLQDRRVHPAAPVMLAGAALEEMLRAMIDASNATPKGKPGISSYAGALREAELLTVQEVKDITSWGGMRNHAAHGDFGQIELPNARLMAQGINLFMQKHSP